MRLDAKTENVPDHRRVLHDVDAENVHAGPDEVGRLPVLLSGPDGR